jgi:hypothetical protein
MNSHFFIERKRMTLLGEMVDFDFVQLFDWMKEE